MMKRLAAMLCYSILASVLPGLFAEAIASTVSVRIDISNQSMVVHVNGWPYGRWRVSTARPGYHTPRGSYQPFLLKKMHYSSRNSPMPDSIFVLGRCAIHGTGYVKSLGRPASHGCIRLAPHHAAKLYRLVEKHGLRATRITITN